MSENLGTGLETYLTNKRIAMATAASSYSAGDDARETISAECSTGDLTGARHIRIRDFELISDSGQAFGGFSMGPSSPELLLGVLASCLNHTYLIGAALMAVSLDSVHVRFEAENNDAGFLGLDTDDPSYPDNIRARVKVQSRAPEPDLEKLHAYVAQSCPLTRLVREPLSVSITVDPMGG